MKHIFDILAFCVVALEMQASSSNVVAQPFPPPAGWEYVRSFDSLDIMVTHARGDTITVTGKDIHAGVNWFEIFHSTNGGASWDSTTMLHSIYGPSGFFPKSNTMWFWGLDSGKIFMTTEDGGRIYTTFRYAANDPIQFQPDTKDMVVNPFDKTDLVVITDQQFSPDEYDQVFRSRDGGRSWTPMTFPAGAGIYSAMFDVRQQGLWYVNARSNSGGSITYRTNDNGSTFVPIGNNWGRYCGIAAPGVFRNWWVTDSYITVIGVADIKDDQPLNSADSVNWIGKMDTLLPEYNSAAGHSHELNYSFYSVYEFAPETALITNIYDHWNPQTDSIFQEYSYVYHTTNDGTSWQLLWGDVHSAGFCTLDESAHRAWIESEDLKVSKFHDYVPRNYSLWKHSLNPNSVSTAPNGSPCIVGQLHAFPTIVRDKISVQLEILRAGHTNISICDPAGRGVQTLIDSRCEIGRHNLEFNLRRNAPSGACWMRFEVSGSVFYAPIVIMK